MAGVLHRRIRTIAKLPEPRRRTAGRGIGKGHRLRGLASTWCSRKVRSVAHLNIGRLAYIALAKRTYDRQVHRIIPAGRIGIEWVLLR